MPPKRKRVEKEAKETGETNLPDYSKLYSVEINIHEYHHDQHLHEVLLFRTLQQALAHKQKICKCWSDGSDDFDFDSEEFFNELEFDETIEGFEDGNHVCIKVREVGLNDSGGKHGEIFRIGDDCEL